MTSLWQYTTRMIREGFEKHHVDMWHALCQQAKTDVGKSREYLFILLDMARHNDCDVLDIIKTGEVCSKQKNINEKFMSGLTHCLVSDDEVEIIKPGTGVLDLTAEEELAESGSYEEEGEGPFDHDDNPTSADAYEIDGFVVADHQSPEHSDDDNDNDEEDKLPLNKARKLKRRLSTITEDEE